MKEPALREEALVLRLPPDEWLQRLILGIGDACPCAEVEVACAFVLEGREVGMLAKDVGGPRPGKGLTMTEPLRHLGEDPPILTCLSRSRQKRSLARDAPL